MTFNKWLKSRNMRSKQTRSKHELSSLAEDIKQNGLQNAITLCEGKILDGRNRFEACRIAGVEPEYETFVGDDPLKAVISLNLMRRHLDESQRAVIASRVANMTQSDAGRLYGRGMNSSGKNADAISQAEAAALFNVSERMIRTVKAIEPSANLPNVISQAEAANMFNVSPRMIRIAKADGAVSKETIRSVFKNLKTEGPGTVKGKESGERTAPRGILRGTCGRIRSGHHTGGHINVSRIIYST